MQNKQIENRIIDAMAKQEPKIPQIYELGGGYFFRCHWMSCNADINRFMNYCPICGQRIDWEGIE